MTFDHNADHLVDFAERNPEQAAVMADLAQYLAAVEDVEHDHAQGEPGSEISESR